MLAKVKHLNSTDNFDLDRMKNGVEGSASAEAVKLSETMSKEDVVKVLMSVKIPEQHSNSKLQLR